MPATEISNEIKTTIQNVDTRDGIGAKRSADWADRVLSEITTAGYRPNH
jgi:hypothetical protein